MLKLYTKKSLLDCTISFGLTPEYPTCCTGNLAKAREGDHCRKVCSHLREWIRFWSPSFVAGITGVLRHSHTSLGFSYSFSVHLVGPKFLTIGRSCNVLPPSDVEGDRSTYGVYFPVASASVPPSSLPYWFIVFQICWCSETSFLYYPSVSVIPKIVYKRMSISLFDLGDLGLADTLGQFEGCSLCLCM